MKTTFETLLPAAVQVSVDCSISHVFVSSKRRIS